MRRRATYARPRREAHEKAMGSYELHAWRDAMTMAQDLQDFAGDHSLSLSEVRRRYEAIDAGARIDVETGNSELITTYLQKTDGQRPAYFRKITKNASFDTQIVFLVLCILGAVRAKELLELRDNFRMVLAPGRGNRVTIAGAYAFASQVEDLFVYDWPGDVFDAMGLYDFDDDDDDDEN